MAKNGNKVDQTWSPEFQQYAEMIVNHPNYKGLYYDRNKQGRINWVVTGKSQKGQQRLKWWINKCKELGIKLDKGCYAKAARAIHPTGYHVCQCCGKKLSIRYEYPGVRLIKKINEILNKDFKQSDYTIKEIIEKFVTTSTQISKISALFNHYTLDKKELIHYIYKNLVEKESKLLSPGAMCNPPDRFDGFHTYGLCCRKVQDTGRHDDNMKRYGQDRRAYEEWADGDVNLANKYMNEYERDTRTYECPLCHKKARMSADHIGPISLGFCHSIYNFQPLCSSCNSAKNNRFYYEDVRKLIHLELMGHQVITWHNKYVWDKLKNKVNNDEDAKKFSKVLLTSHQNVLKIFAIIYKKTGEDFLKRYLHPEVIPYNYEFEHFNPFDIKKLVIHKRRVDNIYKYSNQQRYIRIAFESLQEFDDKDNRNTAFYYNIFIDEIDAVIVEIRKGAYDIADKKLRQVIVDVEDKIIKKEW